MDSQKFFQNALERRTERLAHLIEISAPPQLISNEITLIVQAAMGYCPDEMGKAMSGWLSAAVRRDAGYCRSCDSKILNLDNQCPTCKETSHAQTEIQIQSERA